MIPLNNYKIKPKRGGLIPFTPNYVQRIVQNIQKKYPKVYILKGRQMGITTLKQIEHLNYVISNIGVYALTIADRMDNAKKIFGKVRVAFDSLPDEVKGACMSSLDNVRELYIKSNESGVAVDITGRSQTIQRLHLSEFAFYTNKLYEEAMTGASDAVPQDGKITIETTANGMNHAYVFWNDDCNLLELIDGSFQFRNYDATKPFVSVFLPFFWHSAYTSVVPESLTRGDLEQTYDELTTKYDLYPKAYAEFNLSDGQLFWYITKARKNKQLIKREYPLFAKEAFLSSGGSVFNLTALDSIETPNIKEVIRGVNIYKKPEAGHDYIIGIDPAEGVGGDFSAMEVIDTTDPKNIQVVAEYRNNTIEQHELGKLGAFIGSMYNNAYIVPESNIGLLLIQTMLDLGYSNIYKQVKFDEQQNKETQKVGWKTTGANRDLIIDNFIEVYQEGEIQLGGFAIEDMRTFVRKENGKREHESGFHDDNLFALFLALIGIRYRIERGGLIMKL